MSPGDKVGLAKTHNILTRFLQADSVVFIHITMIKGNKYLFESVLNEL